MLFYLQVGRDLIEEETAETDRVKSAIYIYYAKAIGVGISVASVLLYACFQVGEISKVPSGLLTLVAGGL